MQAEFWFTLIINNEERDALVEYQATASFGDVDIEILKVTLDGVDIETTQEEDRAILDACFDRVNDDFIAEQEAIADYLYEYQRDRNIDNF